jgi:ATP-dependent DNA ligase
MLPHILDPMLALAAEAPFDSDQHFFEIKWDGKRLDSPYLPGKASRRWLKIKPGARPK